MKPPPHFKEYYSLRKQAPFNYHPHLKANFIILFN